MRCRFRIPLVLALVLLLAPLAFPQAENVPACHPVYLFLQRMEAKGIITRYRDAILPISRREVGEFLDTVRARQAKLSKTEQGWLADFMSEFHYDMTGSPERVYSLIGSEEPTVFSAIGQEFSNREKFFYAFTDSIATLFTNVLFDADVRKISGDDLGSQDAQYLQVGLHARGTLVGRLGYYLQFTNAQYWGSQELLARDPIISQSYALYSGNTQNFDFSEGYARYDGGIFAVQAGRERLLWGYGADQKMIVSDVSRVFDFIKADFQYKAIKYTFIHGWLLGRESRIPFEIPEDTSYTFSERVIADKYFAAHRFELSFPGLFDLGLQELYIYSNRSVDLAYLNPFVLLESAQRSRGERDNGLWGIDLQTHFIPNLELHGTLLFDDIHIPGSFSDAWYDKHAWQAGFLYADPVGIRNISLFVDYTRVEPWMFGHDFSRDNNYTHNGEMLGAPIGPNADAWTLRLDWFALRNLYLSGTVVKTREGNNLYDPGGQLVKNVGGDPLVPHRSTDPETKIFLDGARTDRYRAQFFARYEPINQMWVEATYLYDRAKDYTLSTVDENHTVIFHLRWEL